ncbi:endoplasmic reticulum oxidoreductin, putative [Bodo saltans]|uniref:Endoplasmic reticulum oxidoreductin, putative n=1 Tax=Bodo saltans TaxID=75058 RepID=A0A0S4JAH9_BODSA|nr:endoplasmic reticulum oxidoreductin, putative [Bodo saltans]|eukprot:CUG86991.1 endoplasmic reticulum oxidoreductin, putative [Bodo saltans]
MSSSKIGQSVATLAIVIIAAVLYQRDSLSHQPSSLELPVIALNEVEDASTSKGKCTCEHAEVLENAKPLLNILDRLVKLPQLRFFRVRLDDECPYWAAHALCMSADNPCQVCTCDEQDVPRTLIPHIAHEPSSSPTATKDDDGDCLSPRRDTDSSREFSHMEAKANDVGDVIHSSSHPSAVDHLSSSASIDEEGEVIVDLVMNPEGNTYYLGEMANKVWDAIYSENCVQLYRHQEERPTSASSSSSLPTSCSELHLLHRLISGLHTSISTHISVNYFKQKCAEGFDIVRNVTFPLFDVNEEEFHRRVLDHPDRVENLLFLHRFVLRAVSKVAATFGETSLCVAPDGGRFYTANSANDAELCDTLQALFQTSLLCSSPSHSFHEGEFFSTDAGKSFFLPQVERTLRNVTSLMDCLTCEKCRLWGKLQLTGLAAAVRLVFGVGPDTAGVHQQLLSTREEVALIQLLRQLTLSVTEVTRRLSV